MRYESSQFRTLHIRILCLQTNFPVIGVSRAVRFSPIERQSYETFRMFFSRISAQGAKIREIDVSAAQKVNVGERS